MSNVNEFIEKVNLFVKELTELQNKYDIDLYTGYIDPGDDDDIIIKNKNGAEKIFLNDALREKYENIGIEDEGIDYW